MTQTQHDPLGWHGTTILCVRKGGQVAMAGDGQVSLGQTVVKGNARKIRRIAGGKVLAGFAGVPSGINRRFGGCRPGGLVVPRGDQGALRVRPTL